MSTKSRYIIFFVLYSILNTVNALDSRVTCGFPGSPAHCSVSFSYSENFTHSIATYTCDLGYELLGPSRRYCNSNVSNWLPKGIPFCVINVATGKAPMQSSIEGEGVALKALDGSTLNSYDSAKCSRTLRETSPWWYVNLLEPFMVQLVRIDFNRDCCGLPNNHKVSVVVRVGNNRPDIKSNLICNKFVGHLNPGRPLFLPCDPPILGAFVSVHVQAPDSVEGISLSICEAFVYTDQALPIESCPQYSSNQLNIHSPPGSIASYNGKCYSFHNRRQLNFEDSKNFCESQNGYLLKESNPALQGFLSWELWRRHQGHPSGQYWLGLIRNENNQNVWNWINGNEVSVSFWNLPGGNNNCARLDGTKGWLWLDTDCKMKLNFVCQFEPTSCGKPEQPPNSTIMLSHSIVARQAKAFFSDDDLFEVEDVPWFSENLDSDDKNVNEDVEWISSKNLRAKVGSQVSYICSAGSILVGPRTRTCMPNGFFSEFPPVCRFIECELPKNIPDGYFVNKNLSSIGYHYGAMVEYSCNSGFEAVGQTVLSCDIDGKWNAAPPLCEQVYCQEPSNITNGYFTLSTGTTRFGTVLRYFCDTINGQYVLIGSDNFTCFANGQWKSDQEGSALPKCRLIVARIWDDSRRPPYNGYTIDKSSAGTFFRSPITNEIPNWAKTQVHLSSNNKVDLPTNSISQSNSNFKDGVFKLNLGGVVAFGVLGGFVFLAALVTTIVILLKRSSGQKSNRGRSRRVSSVVQTSSEELAEGDKEASELVVSTYTKQDSNLVPGHHKRHHHHHHHRSRVPSPI